MACLLLNEKYFMILLFHSFAKARGILPKYFSSRWSFTKLTVPGSMKCTCAFGSDKKSIIGELMLIHRHVLYSFDSSPLL